MFLNDEITTHALRSRRGHGVAWIAATVLVACLMTLLGLAASALAATSMREGLVTPNDMNMGSLLFPSREPGYFVEAPRLKTDVEIDVSGPILRAKVTQRFVNPSKGWVEGTYVFPLPENAAVDTLRMQIGDRFIEGQIKPRAVAQQIYEQAKAEGRKAALLEQQRPNIFTNQVANIGPGETIIVQIEYQEAVQQSSGVFSLRFPMVVAPRYNPQPIVQSVDLNSDTGYAVADDAIAPDNDKITAPVLDPRENPKINPVKLTVNLKAGFPLAEINAPFHHISIDKDDLGAAMVSLKTDEIPADRDFELTWKAEKGQSPQAGLFKEVSGGKSYLLAFVTPPQADAQPVKAVAKREIIFVIDNSGSMAGQSIEQAKKSLVLAISKLQPGDRFNLIRFDDTMTVFFPGLVDSSQMNRDRAIGYVEGLTADGGTEMLPALQAALRSQGAIAPGALRQVVFLTDGAIGNEQQLFEEISANRGDARVFTVGIGSAPNIFFMDKAAELGRGTHTQIGSESQVAERMGELFAKLENPVMTDISATFENAKAEDITPNPIPDLYLGEPVVLTAELAGTSPDGKLQIIGKTGGQPWRVEMDVSKAAEGKGIAKLWARRKIDDFEAMSWSYGNSEKLDKDIEAIAMAHHLVSRVTSLVAVDALVSRPADAKLGSAKLPLNLPEGWDFDKVYGDTLPADLPAGEREALMKQNDAYATKIASAMAAAPTAKAASLVAQKTAEVDLPVGGTFADLQIMIGVILLGLSTLLAGLMMLVGRRKGGLGAGR